MQKKQIEGIKVLVQKAVQTAECKRLIGGDRALRMTLYLPT